MESNEGQRVRSEAPGEAVGRHLQHAAGYPNGLTQVHRRPRLSDRLSHSLGAARKGVRSAPCSTPIDGAAAQCTTVSVPDDREASE